MSIVDDNRAKRNYQFNLYSVADMFIVPLISPYIAVNLCYIA